MNIFKTHNNLRNIKLCFFYIQLCKVINNLHKITTWHEVNKHIDYPFILGHSSEVKNERMRNLIHALHLIQDMVLLFVLNKLVLTLDFNSINFFISDNLKLLKFLFWFKILTSPHRILNIVFGRRNNYLIL